MTFANKLAEFRKEKNITLDELSEISRVPKGTLSKISSGIIADPKLETAKSLLYALDKTLDDLEDDETYIEPVTEQTHNIDNIRTANERNLIKKYRTLDEFGQTKLLDYLDDLISTGNYANNKKANLA